MIFTPPSDMSVIMQSRGNPPVANCIFAKFLHARRTLARRFAANMSTLALARCDSLEGGSALPKNCWNWPSAAARNVIDMFEIHLPNPAPLADSGAVEPSVNPARGHAAASQFSANLKG
ncbi:hypothetical protein [Bradyrhizobium paxllaeri]|uniref:hypothetical protein n=1 Tax=Bradyrhizobium paxllaeri TaxID=190148 RepID=UPI001FE80D34|nr:hypothetical protein [Bradyrhizobium paxllaeri]